MNSFRQDSRRAFTLIEIMAAMAVLAILVLMMGRVLSDTSRAWETGSREGEGAAVGRAILGMIVEDLTSAFVGPDPATDQTGFTTTSNSVSFVKRQNARIVSSSDRRRGVVRVGYRMGSYSALPSSMQAHVQTLYRMENQLRANQSAAGNLSGGETVYYFVRSLQVQAYEADGSEVTMTHSPVLPAWLDVHLSVVTDTDALGFADMDEQQRTFRTQRFSTRVYFPQRLGHQGDRI